MTSEFGEKRKRGLPYIFVTWISGLLAGSDKCVWRVWYRSRFEFEAIEEEEDRREFLAEWTLKHDAMVKRRAEEWRRQGYLIKMEEVVTVPKWARRLPRVLRSLPAEIVDYKGLTRYRQTTIDWLSKYDDGAPTSPGIFPD